MVCLGVRESKMFEGHDNYCEENAIYKLLWSVQNNVLVSHFSIKPPTLLYINMSFSFFFAYVSFEFYYVFIPCTIYIKGDMKYYSRELSQIQASHWWIFNFTEFHYICSLVIWLTHFNWVKLCQFVTTIYGNQALPHWVRPATWMNRFHGDQ